MVNCAFLLHLPSVRARLRSNLVEDRENQRRDLGEVTLGSATV